MTPVYICHLPPSILLYRYALRIQDILSIYNLHISFRTLFRIKIAARKLVIDTVFADNAINLRSSHFSLSNRLKIVYVCVRVCVRVSVRESGQLLAVLLRTNYVCFINRQIIIPHIRHKINIRSRSMFKFGTKFVYVQRTACIQTKRKKAQTFTTHTRLFTHNFYGTTFPLRTDE